MIPHRGSCAAGATVLLFLLSLSFMAPPASALTLDLLVANDHNATTTANVPVTVNVLAGDSCVLNGLPCVGGMKTVAVSRPSHGAAVINPDYTVTYTPTLAYVGSDSFTYTAHDMLDLLSGTGTVHMTVNQRSSSISIALSATSVVAGGRVTLTATVTDTSQGTPSTPTGTASWSAGGVGGSFSSASCGLSSVSSSQSSCSTTYVAPASAGTATISASYSGDSPHTASSGSSSLTVNLPPPHPSSTSVSPNPASVTTGSQITFVATVRDTGSTPTSPSGTVTWNAGSAGGSFSSSTCSLTSAGTGTSSCQITYTAPTAATSATITASYSGDSTHSASSGTSSLTVNPLPPHPTSAEVSPNPSSVVAGTSITFSATVTDTGSSPSSPSGKVTWSDGGAGGSFTPSACTLAPAGSSAGSCTTSYAASSSAAAVTITASYSGDSKHASSSGTTSLTVTTPPPHSTTLAISPNPASTDAASAVTFTATVTDASSSPSSPSGSVSWSDGGAGGSFSPTSCSLSSSGPGGSSCQTAYTASTAASSVTITASYLGDGAHSTSSGTSSLTVNAPAPHSTAAVVSPNPSFVTAGNSITFTATVTDTTTSPTYPTGSLSWSDGGSGGSFSPSTCALATDGAGTTFCSTSYTPVSTATSVTITASYSGDSTHSTSAGTSSLTVNPHPNPTTSTVSPNPAAVTAGSSITFTAVVTDNDASPTSPTGTVSWSDGGAGGTFTSTACSLASIGSSAGSCQVSYTPSSTSSSVTITANYGGDATHATSSGTSSLTVNQPPHPTTTSVTPNPSSATPGTSTTFTATVADSSSTASPPTGTVSWTDGGAGGSFGAITCSLSSLSASSSTCSTVYTPSSSATSVTITAGYSGDFSHSSSTGTASLTITHPPHSTSTSVSPNPSNVVRGNSITYTATVTDTSSTPSSPPGSITWSDSGAGGSFSASTCTLASTGSSASSCQATYTPSSTSTSVAIIASYSGAATHGASSGTSSLTVTASQRLSIVKQTSGLIVYDPLNNVTMKTGDTSKYWTYGGSAQGQGAPFSYSEDTQGFHIGVQAKAPGMWAGFYAVTPLITAQLFHAVITEPVRTIPDSVFNTALYVQTGNGLINYVTCIAQTTSAGTTWAVWSATGNTTFATTFTQLWVDTTPNQPLTRSCTIITNGNNYLSVYLDNVNVYQSNQLNLQMASPFMAFIESQSSYAGQMFIGTFTDFYVSTTPTLTVSNVPSSASTVQLVDSFGNVLASSPVSNGVATFDIARYTFPLSASIVVKDSSGSTVVASGTLSLVGGDVYTVVAS